MLDTVKAIAKSTKTAIISNGKTVWQKIKIEKTGLDKIFDVIIISEEAGEWNPDPQIFTLALKRLGLNSEEALFVGDHLKNDIDRSQQVNIKGAWFNPQKLKNNTKIIPFKEITYLSQLLLFI